MYDPTIIALRSHNKVVRPHVDTLLPVHSSRPYIACARKSPSRRKPEKRKPQPALVLIFSPPPNSRRPRPTPSHPTRPKPLSAQYIMPTKHDTTLHVGKRAVGVDPQRCRTSKGPHRPYHGCMTAAAGYLPLEKRFEERLPGKQPTRPNNYPAAVVQQKLLSGLNHKKNIWYIICGP